MIANDNFVLHYFLNFGHPVFDCQNLNVNVVLPDLVKSRTGIRFVRANRSVFPVSSTTSSRRNRRYQTAHASSGKQADNILSPETQNVKLNFSRLSEASGSNGFHQFCIKILQKLAKHTEK